MFNDIEWKRSIKMRSDKGKLKLTAKVSASQKLNQPATVEWENVAKSKTKNTSPAETLVSLFADNFGIEFLSLQATVPTTIKTLNSIETKRNGTTKLASKQSIKGSKR